MQPFRDRYLAVLVEVEQKLLVYHDLHSCYDKILELVGQAVNASCTYLVEATGDTVNPFSLPIAEWYAAPATYSTGLSWQNSLSQTTMDDWLATLRRGQILSEPLPEPSFAAPHQGHRQGLNAATLVLLPLVVQGELYGVFGLEYALEADQNASEDTSESASKLDISALQLLQGVAIALSRKLEQCRYHARFKDLLQQVQQLQADLKSTTLQHTLQLQKSLDFEALLKRITDRVRDSLDERQILQTAVQELATGLGIYSCDAALYDLEQGTSTIAYEYINSAEISPARGTVFHLVNYPDIYAQLLQGQYLQFCWVTPPAIPRNLKTRLVILGCPIIDDQGVIGDLWLYNTIDTHFELEEVRLVEQVANQCAIALRQARLYQEAQAQVQKLEHLHYLKDDFLNTVSHELRSPMANIEMAIQMLEMLLFQAPQPVEPDSTAEPESADRGASSSLPQPCKGEQPASSFQQALRYFRMLQEECMRETHLINDLLDLSRLEGGTEPIFLTAIHLQAWIPHVVEPFLERARNQQQRLRIDIPQSLPPLSTDLSGLERILSELLHNACKYTPAGEEICVSAALAAASREDQEKPALSLDGKLDAAAQAAKFNPPPTKMLCLRISNSGVEISPSELSRVFDKFYRIPGNDPWKQGGTGLGLALVQRLVDHLSATIEVESVHNQVTFTIRFAV